MANTWRSQLTIERNINWKIRIVVDRNSALPFLSSQANRCVFKSSRLPAHLSLDSSFVLHIDYGDVKCLQVSARQLEWKHSQQQHTTQNHRKKRKMKCYSSAQFLLFGWMVCGVYMRRTTARTLVNCVYYYRFDTFLDGVISFFLLLYFHYFIFILFAFAIETKYMQILRGRGEWGGKSEQRAEEKRKLCECENRFNWWKWQN